MSGNRLPLKMATGSCGPDAAETLIEFPLSSLPPETILAWSFTASNGMNGSGHHVPDTYKALDLKPSDLSMQVRGDGEGGFILDVTASGLALFVMIESDVPGRFSDNLFDLASGDARRVSFHPTERLPAGEVPRFTLYDLHSSQSTPG